MTRGDREFEDYVRYLKEKKDSGKELTPEEQGWLGQGLIAGIISEGKELKP